MESMTDRLSHLLALKGIKNIDLAEATLVNASTISRILKGTQIPTADTLYKFAQFFDVTMEFLLTGKNNPFNTCANETFNPKEIRLISYYRDMEPMDQEDLILIAEMKATKRKRGRPTKLSPSESDDKTIETA